MGIKGAKAAVFTKFDQTGQMYSDLALNDERYSPTRRDEFLGTGVYEKVSSIRVLAGAGAPGLLLFKDYQLSGGFDGEFMQFTNASDVTFNLDLEGGLEAFNNTATSMVVVETQLATESRISFQATFVPAWNAVIDDKLPSNIQKIGNPTVRWAAFPENQPHLSPNRVYVRIKQRITVVIDNWPDYEASFTYWIRFRAKEGKAVASVSQWAYWVEAGIFAGVIGAALEAMVHSGASSLTTALNSALATQDGVTAVYLLPGNQTTQVEKGFHDVHWSDSRGDATVVIQL